MSRMLTILTIIWLFSSHIPGFQQSNNAVTPGDFIVEPYLESHYRLVQVVDGFRIMERIAH